MKITIDFVKKATLLIGGLFLSSLSTIKADGNMPSGLTPEMLLPQFTNMTPEAASLGRYGAFQVSEYSGAANISIPLYTVKSGDVSFPINLYYDATGIKVEQDATFVGLGWNLSYGGMISHVVCGEDDFLEFHGWPEYDSNWWNKKEKEIKSKIYNDAPFCIENYIEEMMHQKYPYGPWFYHDTIDDKHFSDIVWRSDSDRDKELKLFDEMSKGFDVPDVFQASFCGHNISFTIDIRAGKESNKQYPIIILNNNPQKYKISYKTGEISNLVSRYPTSFVITDDKGITYCFKKAYQENPWPNVYNRRGYDSYYLTKIYGPDGENGKSKVEFDYKQIFFSFGSSSRTALKGHQPTVRRFESEREDIPPGPASDIYNNLMLPNTREIEIACGESGRCNKVYPSRIITRLDTIEFNTANRLDIPGAKCISGIIIKSRIGNAQRKISFTYDNFSEATGSYKRLKLTSVKIDDQKYKFEYDESIKIPSFASYSKDYWGYYNGANPNAKEFVGCSPAYEVSNGVVKPVEHLDGSNRLASEKLCKVGMLKKIIYPTGGYTLYEFEANRFNDKYYYPDASHNISFPPATIVNNESLNMYGTMTRTLNITPSQENVELKIEGQLYGSSDNFTVTVKNNSGSLVRSLYYYNNGNKFFGETVSLSLTKGATYTIEAKLNAATSSGSNTLASCSYRYYVKNTNITASPTTKDENGGYSIGGGVRVKTIKNYDSDDKYLNGVKYEYSGGKLLSPTVQLETHYVDCNYENVGTPYYLIPGAIRFSFLYANTEPSYPYICSLGIPATVGYDRVVKKEIDESEKVTYRKTVLDFHNYGYDTSYPTSLMESAFYFPPTAQGNLTNGLIKNESIFNGSALISTIHYDYKGIKLDTIYYQKCLPLHLPIKDAVENYMIAFFRKCNTWSYLTSKTETQYDKNGKPLTSNTTSFQYNPTNYQLSDLSVTDGTNTSRTLYSYPASNTLRFMKNVLSEVDGVETYKNGTFTGGSKNTYKVHKNPQTGVSFSVVEKCCSILPNASKSKVTEMTVTSYDDYGNIREYTKKNGTPVTIIWSYNHQLPIMEIVGCTYDEACKKATSLSSLEDKPSVAETTISSIHSTLMKGLPNAYVTAYTYSPWLSVSQIIKPNGEKTAYSYDSYGRLTTVLDANLSTFQPIQMYNYNYKNK